MIVSQAFAQTEATTVDQPAPGTQPGQPAANPTEGTHAEVSHGHGGEHEGFPPFNSEKFPSQLLWLAITFGVFYYVLDKVILPRIAGILENRRDRIALDLEAAERMKSDADEAKAAYEQELAEARDRSHKIAHDAREEARSSADKERKRLDAELDEKLEAAQARIDATRNEALREVDQIATETADAILHRIAGVEADRGEIAGAVTSVRS